ncbi:sensor histidine kinase [Amycolatopsis pigmentata]|uniref:histidine kinase n=1 Tax=Amycolatopsis pigmentata TaxID=450801 RepID=A0ABW5FS86_9PSEU
MRNVSGALARQSMLVAGVCVVTDGGQFLILGPPLTGWRPWALLVATVIANAALALPARWSGAVLVGHAALTTVGPVLGLGIRADDAGLLIAGYRAGAWLGTRSAAVALAALMAALVASPILAGNRVGHDWRLLVLYVLMRGLLPWLVGRYTTARRAYLADLEQRETEAVRRAVIEERGAIARDLHDVISHHVSAIGIHAGAARLALAGQDADGPVPRSLSAVEKASRSAMSDLHRLLDLLHGQSPEALQPGLNDLCDLLHGLPARLVVHGKARELPPSLEIALYRIAQEALTNALRHGDGGSIEVELAYTDNEVALTVTNTVPREARQNGERHHGLAGIRRRVTLYGGKLGYGPEDGRWRLTASFQLEGEPTVPIVTNPTTATAETGLCKRCGYGPSPPAFGRIGKWQPR